MGSLIFRGIKHRGAETLSSSASSLFEIGARDIDGNEIERLGDICQGKKCILVVNVASS